MESLKQTERVRQEADAARREIQQGPALAEAKQRELDQPLGDPDQQFSSEAPLETVEGWLAETARLSKDWQTQLEGAENDLKTREQKEQLEKTRAEIAAELSRLNEINEPVDSPPQLIEALRAKNLARTQQLEAEQALVDVKQQRLGSLVKLFRLRRDVASRKADYFKRCAARLQTLADAARKSDAEKQAREARELAYRAHASLSAHAQRNEQLSKSLSQTAAERARVKTELEWVRAQTELVAEGHARIQRQKDAAGSSTTFGRMLRDHRRRLPKLEEVQGRVARLHDQIPRANLALLDSEEELRRSSDIEGIVRRILELAGKDEVRAASVNLPVITRDLVVSNRDLLEDLVDAQDSYLDELTTLSNETKDLFHRTEETLAYIDENVLWIRSTDPLTTEDFSKARDGLLALFFSPAPWRAAVRSGWEPLLKSPLLGGAILFSCAILVSFRGRIRARLIELDSSAAKGAQSYLVALEATLWTAVMASMWPPLIWLIGDRLANAYMASDLVHALGQGLSGAGAMLWATEFLRQVVRPNGLAEKQFLWPAASLKPVRLRLIVFLLFATPLLFLTIMVSYYEAGRWSDSLGRMLFILGMTLLSAFTQWCVRPKNGLLDGFFAANPHNWITKSQGFWRPLFVVIPLVLAVAAAAGYYYSALQLAMRIQFTARLALLLLVVHALAYHCLLIVRRNLAARQQQERLLALRAKFIGTPEDKSQATLPEVDIEQLKSQIQYLLRLVMGAGMVVGSCLIWSQVLPAIRKLDDVVLWRIQPVAAAAPAEGAKPAMTDTPLAGSADPAAPLTAAVERNVDGEISLLDLLLAAAITTLTVIASRSAPTILQLTVLNRLPIDRGAKHAMAVLSGYLLSTGGFILAFGRLGMSWNSVQWLVAAMTVGLGFGLQEIFANFVSGLIILFERPVRVGDLVTVGGVTGVVTKMQIRATTITDVDRREMLVPNKKFITDEVLNWTLTDTVSRVVIPLGVAYGSDTQKTHDILMELIKQHPIPLKEPAPLVVFRGFGESTLDFELMFYLPSRDSYFTVLHQMNTAIEKRFRDEGIEIAFPQRDVNIRGLDTLAESLSSALKPAAPSKRPRRAA